MSIIKAETNIPLVGSFKYADGAEGKFGPQIVLNGTWEGHGQARVYLPWSVADRLMELGAIGKDGKTTDKGTSYPVRGNPRVTITRRDKGYEVDLNGGTTPPPPPASAPAKPAAPAAGPAAQPQAATTDKPGVRFKRMLITHAACIEHGKAHFPNSDEAAAAAANTVYIQCARENLFMPLPAEPAKPEQLAAIATLAAALNWDESDLVAELNGAFKHGDVKKLTDQQAAWFAELQKHKVQEKADAAKAAATTADGEIPWA